MALTDAEILAMGFGLPVGTELIREGDNEISKNARAAAEGIKSHSYKQGTIPANVDIREFMYGKAKVGHWESAIPAEIRDTYTGLPPQIATLPIPAFTARTETYGNGTVLFLTVYSVFVVREFICTSAPSTGDGWTRWKERQYVPDGSADDTPVAGARASGFKTLPLILTAGRGGGEALAPLSANVEYDVNLSPSIHAPRARIAIRDGNPRWGTFTAQTIALTNITLGGIAKLSSLNTKSDGSITFSPYFPFNSGNLKFDYVAQQQPRYLVGGGRVNGARRTEMPFEIWLEIEVPVGTPAIGLVGDSNSVGVNTTIPVNDSWMAIYCRRMGFFPVLYGHSGDAMSQAQTVEHYKWNRWNHLDRPDMVVHANGANDIPDTEGGLTLAQLQERARLEWEISDAKISKIKHGALLKSRASGINNALRLQWNNWLKSVPAPLRDWQDIAAPVTAGDAGGLLPQYISSDGLHMNTAGQAAIGNSALKVMTTREGLVFDHSVGRVAKAWDSANQREQVIYGDTGLRDVTSLFSAYVPTAGSAYLQRVSGTCYLTFEGIKFAANGSGTPMVIPSGFRPQRIFPVPMEGLTARAQVTQFGNVQLFNWTADKAIYGTLSWPCGDPWPTSLPGLVVGSIPA